MGERLAGGNTAIALLANALATGAGLAVLILIFAPISGAHFNPAVTLAFAIRGEIAPAHAAPMSPYRSPPRRRRRRGASHVRRAGAGAVDQGAHRRRAVVRRSRRQFSDLSRRSSSSCAHAPGRVAYAVGLYITAAYWFTASTSFANPAVTVGAPSPTPSPASARSTRRDFVVAQIVGATVAALVFAWLWRKR